MKKLLFQLDTDPIASVFDTVVGYDGGADHVIPLSNIRPDNCAASVEGAIFTRARPAKKNTALFVGGTNLSEGEAVFAAVRGHFFSDFQVSVMLDSNGGNTTAAAAVALLADATKLDGSRAMVLAGTGPVGRRAAALLALEGAEVTLGSRSIERSEAACAAIQARFKVRPHPVQTPSSDATAALARAQIVLAAGKSGVQLLAKQDWENAPALELLADLSTTPPAGIEGIDVMDRNTERAGRRAFGGIGIGALKLRVHRACVAQLFDSNHQVLDAEGIYVIARSMLTNG